MYSSLLLLLGALLPSTLAAPADFSSSTSSALSLSNQPLIPSNATDPALSQQPQSLLTNTRIVCRKPAPIRSVTINPADCKSIIGYLDRRGDFLIHPTDPPASLLMEGRTKRAGCRIRFSPDPTYHGPQHSMGLNRYKVEYMYQMVMGKPCAQGGDMTGFFDVQRRISLNGWVFSVYHPYWDNNGFTTDTE